MDRKIYPSDITREQLELTSFGIVDAQSVKNTDTAQEKGYDAGKKVSGIKRHITVDTNGLPHAILVTTANVSDRAGALAMFLLHDDTLSPVVNILVDGGYTGADFANNVKAIKHRMERAGAQSDRS